MLIICPSCATSYQIKLAALGEAGRTVRCANCKNTWFAAPESALMEEAPQPAVALAAAAPGGEPAVNDFAEERAGNFPDDVGGEASEPDGQMLAVTDAPPLAPDDRPADATPSATKFDPGEPESTETETIAARRARHAQMDRKSKRTPLQRIFSLPVLIVVLAAVLIGALTQRVALVRQFPQTASLFAMLGMPVNLRGLSFMDVKSRSEFVDGAAVLVVEGTIVNLTPKTLEIPRLRLALRNNTGHEVYAWTAVPSRTTLGSGDGLPFRSRLASPPVDGRDVIVRFFSRRDAGPGS